MSTAAQLNKILGHRKDYAGVFLYDQIGDIKVFEKKAYIVNYITTQEITIEGHYVVLDFRGDQPYYFDAYGLPPDRPRDILGLPNPHIVSRILNNHGSWEYNKEDYQAWIQGDNDCGQYCTMFIIQPDLNKFPWVGRLPQPYEDQAVALFGLVLN